jgi:hypothetical protein
MAYNTAKHSATGKAPFELERGFLPLTPRHLMNPASKEFHVNHSSESYSCLIQLARDRAKACVNEYFDYAKQ